ncbi:hypothetical protein [Streptomyces roseicoloratus]|uniref:Uncharacterized protein n=1 Tax=Streptomyces roseicoloratus TaxID=2508722 RepID=A0ABY9RQ98_9ACTN|nr:hypothetical protein [Streptomyces roseicoloratus]WMX44377.1 hypothetical protein RGF97_05225 [Streptomyces roseicoloratus]
MLGEQIGDEQGQTTGMRVVSVDGGHPHVEASFQATGTLLGVAVTDMGTYDSVMQPDGTLFGDGQGCSMTQGGDIITWHATGAGRMTESGGISYRGAIFFESASADFSRLNGTAAVFEYEEDKDGKNTAKVWEWT